MAFKEVSTWLNQNCLDKNSDLLSKSVTDPLTGDEGSEKETLATSR